MAAESRIQRLRSLIEHPRTGAAERAAAQRLLDRILGNPGRARPTAGDRSYGQRHSRGGRHAGLSRLADMIREDIALARVFADAAVPGELAARNAIRDAPEGITYTVDTPFDAGIRILVAHVPPTWGWSGPGVESEALRLVRAELADIMAAYDHDGGDIGQRFHGRVEVREAGW
ncbi:hypothetical protein [Nocardia seriolae]|uniref:Uncharacterized protein n=1 Tax=Nocardia seriolae TaxID=37332 RepID=A0A0B8N2M6_9NOCA|nr:hypothetical protein [Nocardia seriolae]APA98813.1 hypothetical protein NS506_04767 [Nocardia seriolae]MTJ63884.1 hypothetical protein [Nocardia seriolae]MTJ71483.1 hypothetical protein [Nocardia seriolae]MTJ88443.1 hypothetical protein [Nocardia seriolae]MTK32428.1 hypothetical protein [Nocardia seriolae]